MANSVFLTLGPGGSGSSSGGTTTFAGTVASDRVLLGDGTAALPSLAFTSEPGLGMYRVAAGVIGFGSSGSSTGVNLTSSGLNISAAYSLYWGSDVFLNRGAANRLDLATGDSLYLVSGGLGVGAANTVAGSITATGNISVGNSNAFVVTSNGTLSAGGGSGKINLTDANATTGVGFDVATDGVLKIRSRAQSAYATVDALGYSVSGVAGASKTAGPVTSITVVNGIVTAIS